MQALLLAALMSLGAAVVLAQSSDQDSAQQTSTEQSEEQAPPIDPAPAAAPAPAYVPLNLKQKYLYSMGEIFGPDRLVAIAAYATLDQMGVRPAQWGRRPSSLAVRFASHFGDSLLKHNIEFGVRAIDHEDPRYFRSGRGRPWTRTGYAMFHTFVVHNDRGGWMPAYSLVAADVATPCLGAPVAAATVRNRLRASGWNPQHRDQHGNQYLEGILAGLEECAAELVYAPQSIPAARHSQLAW